MNGGVAIDNGRHVSAIGSRIEFWGCRMLWFHTVLIIGSWKTKT
jgi:hypothetical protein